ncbi:uncharacterized protein LOC129596905 [Paramacrobiotus metropolitanus]|uniref:uncharacterized protein LOC129596905 n=1 Tax=Paramacrobiotus metropolitanus TaxID=2943436 RepID=UPI0024459C5D|nr:uncharacterized protein LOC129596905 [Paramacrobiotus metropolitanus]
MKQILLAGLLIVAAMSMAADLDHSPQSECCSARKYTVPISPIVAPPKDPKKPWQYAVRVGQILYVTSVRGFTSLANRTISDQYRTYSQALQIMKLTGQILNEAGCKWSNVHDVTALVTGGPEDFPIIEIAMKKFCAKPENNCSGFPWAAHMRSAPLLAGDAWVEFSVQASYCDWKPEGH